MIEHQQPTPVLPLRVVVLGGSGFVGRDLVRHLTELGVSAVPLSSAQVDLSDGACIEALRGAVGRDDALVVASAITPDKGRDVATMMKNLTMGAHLSAFLARYPCSHVVYISSDAIYEDGANPVGESSCCNPSSFHGLMHLARERMLAHTLRDSETPFLALRPSLLYGSGDTHNGYGPNRFLRTSAAEGKIILFGRGEEKRDHVFVQDLSRLIGICLAYRAAGTLNVASGVSTSFYHVARLTAEVCEVEGCTVRIECLPRQQPITHRHFDTVSTLRAFPAFTYTPLRAGIARTWQSLAPLPIP